MWDVEISTEAVKSLLHMLMARQMRQQEDFMAQVPMIRHKNTGAVEKKAVVEAPRRQ